MSLKPAKTLNVKKSPASNAWGAIFKNADFCYNSLKHTELGAF